MDVKDVFKYFAQFPPKAAVQKLFSENTLNNASYTELKNYVDALPATGEVLPGIEAFVYSFDEDQIKSVVTKTDGYIFMIEHGPINGSARNTVGNREVDFNLSVIVARHFKVRKYDSITESIIMDECLEKLQTVLNHMQNQDEDEDICPFINLAGNSFDIAPLSNDVFGLYESIGYVLSFRRTNNTFV